MISRMTKTKLKSNEKLIISNFKRIMELRKILGL